MSTRTPLIRTIANRAVHLRIMPRPQNLAESREILRLLQTRFGDVEMYKSLKYDRLSVPTTALAIFRDVDAARQLLRQSPLRFTMESDDSGSVESDYDHPEDSRGGKEVMEMEMEAADREGVAEERVIEDRAQDIKPPATPARTGAWGLPLSRNTSSSPSQNRTFSSFRNRKAAPTPTDTGPREYQIQVNLSTMNHTDHINVNDYNGNFAVDTKSAAQEDLAKRVPLIGLSDINLKRSEKPWRVMNAQRERERKGRVRLRDMLERGVSALGKESGRERVGRDRLGREKDWVKEGMEGREEFMAHPADKYYFKSLGSEDENRDG